MSEKGLLYLRGSAVQAERVRFGANNFNGTLAYRLPELYDDASLKLNGYGCAGYMAGIALAMFGMPQPLSEIKNRASAYGITPVDGAERKHAVSLLRSFGLRTEDVKIDSPERVREILKRGELLGINYMEMGFDEVPDSEQQGGGHWGLVVGIDKANNLLTLNSSLRSGEDKDLAYKPMVLPWSAYENAAWDSDALMTPSETALYVTPQTRYFIREGIAIRRP